MSPRARLGLSTTAGVLLVSTVLGCLPAGLPAQQRIPVGARVRVATLPQPDLSEGTVVAADSVRLVLRAASWAKTDTIPVAVVKTIEVSEGRPRLHRGLVGVFGGGAVGGLIGAFTGFALASGSGYEAYAAELFGLAGAAGGAVIGGAAAVLTAPERWTPVR